MENSQEINPTYLTDKLKHLLFEVDLLQIENLKEIYKDGLTLLKEFAKDLLESLKESSLLVRLELISMFSELAIYANWLIKKIKQNQKG